jgi:hypothetical protein
MYMLRMTLILNLILLIHDTFDLRSLEGALHCLVGP